MLTSLNQLRLTVQMIKKYWVYLFFAAALIFFIYRKVITGNAQKSFNGVKIDYRIFKNCAGYGYEILKNDSVYIHQENIPAIEGNKTFVSQQQAEKVAQLVIYKLKNKIGGGLPVVELKDLDSLKITK